MNSTEKGFHFALSPAGAGVLSLFFPGIVVAAVLRQPLLLSVSIGAGLALLANAAAARLLIGGLEVTARGPATSTVGDSYPIVLALEGSRRVECSIAVENSIRAWVPAIVPSRGEVLVRAEQRGCFERIGVRAHTAAPFGLIACIRSSSVSLLRPTHIGPRRVEVPIGAIHGGKGGDETLNIGHDLRGLRPYAHGDSPRDVHWPTVARTGEMMVRDRRDVGDQGEVDVIVDTGGAGCDIEGVLGRARSVLEQLLVSGWQVNLEQAEVVGGTGTVGPSPVRARITSAEDIIKRLARTGTAATDAGLVVGRNGARLVVDDEGQRWQSSS